MNSVSLLQTDGAGCPFPFFGEQLPAEAVYKVYNDGGHYIATPVFRSKRLRKPQDLPIQRDRENLTQSQRDIKFRGLLRDKKKALKRGDIDKDFSKRFNLAPDSNSRGEREAIDILFDSLYYQAFKLGLRDRKLEKPMTEYIREGILKLYSDYDGLNEWIAEKIKSKLNNLHHRKKRFRRKASLNRWNYFVTFTYDNKKQTAESFKKKLRKCLSNLHTRRGWRYMGVFENAPDTGRLHFHGLIYVPDGEMLGTITERRDYSTAQQQMQITHPNSFFEEAFGRNDFEEVTEMELKDGQRQEYILKYIGKTNERICYSRGIPTEICMKIDGENIVTELLNDFVTKYILFDNVIDWERDILRFRTCKQMTIIDLLCNPPKVA